MALSEFKNEPFTDFSKPEHRQAMQAALAKVKSQLGLQIPLVIGGKETTTRDQIVSINPANKDQIICRSARAGQSEVEPAMQAALQAFSTWQYTPAETRASYALRAAELMRARKHEFSAWLVYEVSKTWAEADGDTAEAIDFLEFYGREALRYAQPQPVTPLAGEQPSLSWIPLGVGVVIPPWNFPLAILAGMTTAAFVTGNTVILKPSSDSPGIAWQFFQLLQEVGLPAGVVNFCPGSGPTFGDSLVLHPKTRFISFTGSKDVGLGIVEKAAKTQPGQRWIKRVVAEMGGKDGTLVADDADLDAAAAGIVAAAFGFQGQKCSACSRAIIDQKVYPAMLEKIVQRVGQLKIGAPENPDTHLGAVINQKSYESILGYIEAGKREGRLLTGGAAAAGNGYFIQPTVIADVPENGRISLEEIFGPVLAVIPCKDFEDGLRIANNTEYGLTGAVFTRDRKKLDAARHRFHVGNLYLNRKCTGALVGVHPFGGFNMSGTDSKAGGRDYLALFSQLKSVSEKVG